MATREMTLVLGSLGAWKVTVKSRGQVLTGVFDDDTTLDAKVYRGDGQSVSLSPDVSWVDGSSFSAVRVAITPAMTTSAGVSAGLYKIEVGATPVSDEIRRVVHYGDVRFLGSSGAGSAPLSIATWTDMVTYSSDVAKLEKSDTDSTQFAGQRAKAMGLFIREVARRYNPRPGGSRRLVASDGTTAGTYLQLSPSPDGSPPPSRAQVEAWLTEGGRLAINEDIIEFNARTAAALVYGSSPGQNSPYQQMADKERALARVAFLKAVVEVDAKDDPDGSPTIRVDRDVIYLT